MDPNLAGTVALYDDQAPLAEAYTIPAPWYTDPAIAELEGSNVFGEQLAGRRACRSGAQPGRLFHHRTRRRTSADRCEAPMDVLRAFYNVCRHHAAAVATAAMRPRTVFRCPYHGWNYGLDGVSRACQSLPGSANF